MYLTKEKTPHKTKDNTICIIGMGYVGLTLAIIMSERKFRVYGVENNQKILDELYKGKAHFYEPQIDSRLLREKESGSLSFALHRSPKRWEIFLSRKSVDGNRERRRS
jgi:UDP-N-acetyl-D-mannosaminuronate dehydrogenase